MKKSINLQKGILSPTGFLLPCSFSSNPLILRETQPALDHGGGHEPRPRMLRSSRCHYPEHRRPGKGKRSLQPRLRLGSGLLALALLPDQRILSPVPRHPTDALGLPPALLHEGIPRSLAQEWLLRDQQRENRLQFGETIKI